LYIVGDSIKEVQIYAIDGTLVSNSEDRRSAFSPIQKNGTEFVWEIGKTARNRLVPGLYYAVITPDGAAPKKKIRRKVLFLP